MSDTQLSLPTVPQHIAIIMDGNGRWAQNRHLPRTTGHARGAAIVRGLVEACARCGVRHLTLFAFSTENWKRPADEVSTLMGLFVQYLQKEFNSLAELGVRLQVIGDIGSFPPDLQRRIRETERHTRDNSTITLILAANYGGRWDIVQAVNRWLQSDASNRGEPIQEQDIADRLATAQWPEPDLLIRTGGERRISNFLLWQCAYSELYFTDTLWPDFASADLDRALQWYATRERRFGALPASACNEEARNV